MAPDPHTEATEVCPGGLGRDEEAPPLLENLELPSDLRGLGPEDLDRLAAEVRRTLVATVGETGGHLGPNLGVVEISIAVHRVFTSGLDKVVFDTGHQAYVHKMLTGRAAAFSTLRQAGGLSGYPRRSESPHDLVENSHASTALAYADGLAKAARLRGDDHWVVAVVGDGAMTGGLSWEALNNLAAAPDRRVVIILNDNGRSYSESVGGLARHLRSLREGATVAGGSVFESLGVGYVGPVDGHDRAAVEDALRRARAGGGTTVVHCLTRKGAGHPPAEADDVDHYHSVRGLDENGNRVAGSARTWTGVFGDTLLEAARRRPDLVAVTAAMQEPTGLGRLARELPGRVFDVGIAEQEAVTSAAGLAMGGLHPVVAIYSTFLNRAFDQVLLDVGLHGLPVTFVLDRAGVTGPDGASHHGMWDLALMRIVPGLSIAAPRDATRLREQLGDAFGADHATVVRFPTGAVGEDIPAVDVHGDVEVLRDEGAEPDLLVVGVGAVAESCLAAAELAARASGARVNVVDPGWVWPVSPALTELAEEAGAVLTVEDGLQAAGVGAGIAHTLGQLGIMTPVRTSGLPSAYLPHGSRAQVLRDHGLEAGGLARAMLRLLDDSGAGRSSRRRRWSRLHVVPGGRARAVATRASGHDGVVAR